MCKAIADMIQDGRAEGWSDGEREGKKHQLPLQPEATVRRVPDVCR